MEILAALSVAVLVLSALIIAIKTFALWRRSRELPELLLSLMLFSVTVVGYPLGVASRLFSATEAPVLHLAFTTTINGGFVCLLLFTLRVFRPKVLWARCLVGVTMLILAASAAAYYVEVSRENPRDLTQMVGLTLFDCVGVAIAYFWTTIESLSSYQRLRRQLRLGLTEGIVANRVLLWGLMTLAAGLAVVMNSIASITGSFMSPPVVAISSGLGLLHAGFLLLAFSPPGWYRGWVERHYALENA